MGHEAAKPLSCPGLGPKSGADRRGRLTIKRLILIVAVCAVFLAAIREQPWLLTGLAGFVAISVPALCGASRRRAGRPLGLVGGSIVGSLAFLVAWAMLGACMVMVVPNLLVHVLMAEWFGMAALCGAIYGAAIEGISGPIRRRLDHASCVYDPHADPALRPYLEGTSHQGDSL